MLFELGLDNFKPFGTEQRARLAPITLIYGPNSGGKSSIIQALMLLKQSMEGSGESTGLIARGPLVDLGSFKALIHRHELDRKLEIRLSFDRCLDRERGMASFVPGEFSRVVDLRYGGAASAGSRKKDASQLEEARYSLEARSGPPALDLRLVRTQLASDQELPFGPLDARGTRGVFTWKDAASGESLVAYLRELERRMTAARPERDLPARYELPQPHELAALLEGALVIEAGGIPSSLEAVRRPEHNVPFLLRSARYRVVEGIAREFKLLVSSLAYLGPLRSYPERHYVVHGGTPASVGKRGEYTPQMLYRRKKALTQQVNDWFKRFDIPYQLTVKELEDEVTGAIIVMSLEDRRSKVTVAPSDVGFGIGQLLPILVEGLIAQGRIICVEQPEIHLHPRLQAHLADFFISTSGADSPDDRRRASANQWIVETHSEALMLRIQKRIRQQVRAGKLRADNVSVLYVEPGPGGSTIRRLRLDEDGEFLDPWPNGFFEERFDDMFGAAP